MKGFMCFPRGIEGVKKRIKDKKMTHLYSCTVSLDYDGNHSIARGENGHEQRGKPVTHYVSIFRHRNSVKWSGYWITKSEKGNQNIQKKCPGIGKLT